MYGGERGKSGGQRWGFCLEKWSGSGTKGFQKLMEWFLFQSAGCKGSLEITVGLSLGKSLSLNTSALELKEKMCVLPRLSPTELSQSDSGILHVQP